VGKRRSFTLIELLTVIAIISLLLAILLPSLGAARASARRAVCAANLRQIGIGMRAYWNSSNERFPYASYMPSFGASPLDGNDPLCIADVLAAVTGHQPKVFQCPDDRGEIDREAPNYYKTYFETERSSYEYRGSVRDRRYHGLCIGGKTLDEYEQQYVELQQLEHDDALSEIHKIRKNSFWIFQDFRGFHPEPAVKRYLYADGHVTDFEVER